MAIPIVPPSKVCTKCGQEFPATTEYFQRDKRKKEGLRAACKACVSATTSAYYAAHRDEVCANHATWYAENREERLAYQNAYNAEHREEKRVYSAVWRAKHCEERCAYSVAYYAAHPEKYRIYWHNRRARKRAAEGKHTAADIAMLYKRQRGRCYYAACGHAKLGEEYHVDHVIPLSRGGRNDLSNLVLACPTCNLSKQDRLPHEWAEGGRLL